MKNVYLFSDRATVEAEAREWLIRLDSDIPPTQQEIQALQEWCRRSPAHRKELERISAFWDEADWLFGFAVPNRTSPGWPFARLWRRVTGKASGFRKPLAIAASVALLLGGAITAAKLLESDFIGNRTYSTALGEQLTRHLNDGTTIQLNTRTQIEVAFGDGVRRVHLIRGEAHFDVAPDVDRPFEVHAGPGVIRAVGTAFSVSLRRQEVAVTVSEGTVALAAIPPGNLDERGRHRIEDSGASSARTAGSPLKDLGILNSGQSATFDQAIKQVQNLEVAELNNELAWRKGFLVFNRTPLGEVISEVSRYSSLNIEITDPALRDFPVGGRFKVGELDALIDALDSGFGLQVVWLDKKHVQLSPAKSE